MKSFLEKFYVFDQTLLSYEGYKKIVIVPDNITKIADEAFKGCSGIKEIILPKKLKVIGNYAFYDCYSLERINIPKRIVKIGDGAFFNCISLEEVHVYSSRKLKIKSNFFIGIKNRIKLIFFTNKGNINFLKKTKEEMKNEIMECMEWAWSKVCIMSNDEIEKAEKEYVIDEKRLIDDLNIDIIGLEKSNSEKWAINNNKKFIKINKKDVKKYMRSRKDKKLENTKKMDKDDFLLEENSKFISFQGTVNRKCFILNYIIFRALMFLVTAVGYAFGFIPLLISLIIDYVFEIHIRSVWIRRFKDLGKSPYCVFVPLMNLLYAVFCPTDSYSYYASNKTSAGVIVLTYILPIVYFIYKIFFG